MLTVATLMLFTLLCVALSGDAAWDNVTKPERNDLVFEGRHRAYGAFVLRRDHDQRSVMAFLLAITIISGAIGIPRLLAMINPGLAMDPSRTHTTTVTLEPPINSPSAPVPPKADPPKRATAVTPPIGHDDHAVEPTDSLLKTTTPVDTATTTITPIAPKGGGTGDTAVHTTGTTRTPLPSGPIDPVMADSAPEYPGGERAMLAFVRNNIRFTEGAMGNVGSDKVFVQFVVDADGSVISVKSVKGKFDELKGEAARVVRLMPKWKPALYRGERVPCRLMLPINFELRE